MSKDVANIIIDYAYHNHNRIDAIRTFISSFNNTMTHCKQICFEMTNADYIITSELSDQNKFIFDDFIGKKKILIINEKYREMIRLAISLNMNVFLSLHHGDIQVLFFSCYDWKDV